MEIKDLKAKLKANKQELKDLQEMLEVVVHYYEKLVLKQNIASIERNIAVLNSMIAKFTKSGYIKLNDGSKIKVK